MLDKCRTDVNFFVSYSHADATIVQAFLQQFYEVTAPSKKYHYTFWQDNNILPGSRWRDEIDLALTNCDLGLLLVSPSFLASDFITEKELPVFVKAKAKHVVPLLIKKINFQRHNLKGLEEAQIFGFTDMKINQLRSYSQCNSHQKEKFVNEFFVRVENKLDVMLAS